MHNSGCSFVVVAPRHIWSCLPGFVLAAAELSARLAWVALCALLNRDCAFLLLPAFLPARWWFTSAVCIATRTRMKKMPGTSLKTPIAWVVILILSGRRYICFAMVDFFALGWNSESQLLLTLLQLLQQEHLKKKEARVMKANFKVGKLAHSKVAALSNLAYLKVRNKWKY